MKYLDSNLNVGITSFVVILSLIEYSFRDYLFQMEYYSPGLYVWISVAVTINTLFLIELILHFVAAGPLRILGRKKILIIEVVL